MAEAVKGNKRLTSGDTPFNAISFAIETAIRQQVNTAIPVLVTAVDAGGAGQPTGYVTCKPLITQIDGDGNSLAPVDLFRVPYCRIQGGIAALVCDPVVGDIGLAIFAKSDSSALSVGQTEPKQPASFRKFSMADGFYIGGFLNRAPQVYIEIKQDKSVVITAPNGVTVNAPTVNVPSGDVIASGISLKNHIHRGDSGGTTSPPIG